MIINGIQIDDTFAEAFNMRGTRVIITAQNLKWASHAAHAMTGFATSVIGCGDVSSICLLSIKVVRCHLLTIFLLLAVS